MEVGFSLVDDGNVDVVVRYEVEEEECLPSFVLCVTDEASIDVGLLESCLVVLGSDVVMEEAPIDIEFVDASLVSSDVACWEEYFIDDLELEVVISSVDNEVSACLVFVEVFLIVSVSDLVSGYKYLVDDLEMKVVIALVNDGIVDVVVRYGVEEDECSPSFVLCVTDEASIDEGLLEGCLEFLGWDVVTDEAPIDIVFVDAFLVSSVSDVACWEVGCIDDLELEVVISSVDNEVFTPVVRYKVE